MATVTIRNLDDGLVDKLKAQAKANHRSLEAELREWCAERISKVTQPRSYAFVEELPRIPSGKLAKHELRKLYGNPVAVV